MAVKLWINGPGRIGHYAVREGLSTKALEVAGVNDLTGAHTLAHLLKYDSVHGKFGTRGESDLASDSKHLRLDGKKIRIPALRKSNLNKERSRFWKYGKNRNIQFY